MNDLTVRVAAKALIKYGNKFLILREGASDGTVVGKYQIPGGMVEPGEDFMDALVREVREETGLDAKPSTPIMVDSWLTTIEGVPYQIFGVFYLCEVSSDEVKLSDEHDDYVWITADEAGKYETTPQVKKLLNKYNELTIKNRGEL